MHSRSTAIRVLALCRPGVTTREVALLTGISESTIGKWRRGERRAEPVRASPCPRCTGSEVSKSYASLLGSYLGDGHIVMGRRGVQSLSVAGTDAWPGVMAETAAAMGEALGSSVCRVQRQCCAEVTSYSKHWICLFPQQGPGRKHKRAIVLESRDIMGLCGAALDRLGIAYRMPRQNMLSVARREAVAALDEHVGPKY